MTVVLTGGSSFTGLWFAEELARCGFSVIAPLRKTLSAYTGLKETRIQRLSKIATIIENCPFGSDAFIDAISVHKAEILCHHGAEASNYRSLSFDVDAALRSNTHRLSSVLEAGRTTGLRFVILTGTVFEADEGFGTEPKESVLPYGLSKKLTSETFRFWCSTYKIPLTRFIIPNPFGPYEEQRFCHHLISTWFSGHKALVKTPDYIRDNIHASLLARAYSDCLKRLCHGEAIPHLAPSGYKESQGAFAQRVAKEMASRLPLKCELELMTQISFDEPLERCNTDTLDISRLGWNEQKAWDDMAEYYKRVFP